MDDMNIIKGTPEELLKNLLTVKVNINQVTINSITVTVETIEGIPTSYTYKIEGPDNYSKTKTINNNIHTFDKLKANTEYTIIVTVRNKTGLTKEIMKTEKTTKIGEISLDLTPKDEFIQTGNILITYPSIVEGQVNQYKWCTKEEIDSDECENKDFTTVEENPISISAQNNTIIVRVLETLSSEEALTTNSRTIDNIDNIPPEITLLSTQKTTNSIIIPYSIEEEHIGEVTCKYSDKANTYTSNGTIGDNACTLSNELKDNKTYYYEICVTDLAGNSDCKAGSTNTEEITNPEISIKHYNKGGNEITTPSTTSNGYSYKEVANITFTNTHITTPTYYIKSTAAGVTNNNVIGSCTEEDNLPKTCTNTSTTNIASDTWYKVSGNINITYGAETETPITIYATTYDGKNYSGASTGTTIKIETTAPIPTFVTNGNNTVAKLQSSVVNITENKSGINVLKYKWSTSNEEDASNGPTFNSGDTLTTPANLNGTYYLCVYASDLVGNESNTCSNAFALDNTGPSFTTSVNGGTVTINNASDTSGLHATAYKCGIQDWQESNICTFTSEGSYTIMVRDKALNETSTDVEIEIDPNAPVLGSLTPVKYENNNWVVVDPTSKWYDYSNQEWANAVLLRGDLEEPKEVGDPVTVEGNNPDVVAMFVWIPRYEYKIDGQYGTHPNGTAGTAALPGEIEVKFVTNTPGQTYKNSETEYGVHPAFKFGDKELDGIWVGKFETSHTTLSSSTTNNNLGCSDNNCENADGLRILPSVTSLRYNNISNFFYAAQSMGNRLNIDGDLHMMKNSEWGAAAYLSQSKYGKYGNPSYIGAEKQVRINNCQNSITGVGANSQNEKITALSCTSNRYTTAKGQAASTTGNITGIYDMSGGAEYVMGVLDKAAGSSGLTVTSIDEKYYDNYTRTTLSTACKDENGVGGICYGHALSETSGWFKDNCSLSVVSANLWFARGQTYTTTPEAIGVFGCQTTEGQAMGAGRARIVLTHNS